LSGALDWQRDGRDWPLREHSRFVRSGPLIWHVQRLGEGPAIVLIHGTGASTHSWRDVAPILAERFTVLNLDLPGHGFTRGRLPTGLALPGISRALADLLAVEGIEPVVVAGHSAGAAVAVQLALDGATKAHVAALCPALRPYGGEASGMMSSFAKLLFANPVTPWLAAGVARFAVDTGSFLQKSTGSRIDRRGVQLYGRLFASPAHCAGAIGLMADWELAGIAAALPNLPVPMTVIHGEKDAAVPVKEGREVAEISGGRFIGMTGGHLAHEEEPARAAELIAELAGAEVNP
jgi:magnesium chelatase accessory protein